MKGEILQRLRQQAAGGTLPTADMPKDASDVDLTRQYLDDLESRSVCISRVLPHSATRGLRFRLDLNVLWTKTQSTLAGSQTPVTILNFIERHLQLKKGE